MAPHRPRYHLIDLLMVIALCGLIAAVVRVVVVLASQARRHLPPPDGLWITCSGVGSLTSPGLPLGTTSGSSGGRPGAGSAVVGSHRPAGGRAPLSAPVVGAGRS